MTSNIASGSLPADGVIEIGFDRLLNPLTVTRQTVQLRDAFGQGIDPPALVQYDPVARVVTLAASNLSAVGAAPAVWLKPGQPYKVVLPIATGDDDVSGIRSIDRATLNPATTLEIGFMTTAATGRTAIATPKTEFCRDVLPIFQRSCSAGQCHGTPRLGSTDTARFGDGPTRPAAGLVLEFSSGVLNTAISRVANGSNTGALASTGGNPGRLFGIDMPIIDPYQPANSWLLYKVMLATPTDATTSATYVPAIQTACSGKPAGTPPVTFEVASIKTAPMDDVERNILSDYVLGREMPYPNLGPMGVSDTNPGLTFDELERLRLWIQQGAAIDKDCGACEK